MLARRNVTVAGPPSPSARMWKLVITPSIGAPCDDGSPFGFVGTMNWTIEHAELIGSSHGVWFGSLVVRRLPKLTAALPAEANTSAAAMAASGIRSFLSTGLGPFSSSGDDGEGRAVAR